MHPCCVKEREAEERRKWLTETLSGMDPIKKAVDRRKMGYGAPELRMVRTNTHVHPVLAHKPANCFGNFSIIARSVPIHTNNHILH